ncbi:hypothetical protein ACN08Z_05480 [Rothia sp. P7181]|uniref:hypothetical protein n=1 Tax=Rothia sp. P7181 TaxID=3402663 RepID=UPI003AD945C2
MNKETFKNHTLWEKLNEVYNRYKSMRTIQLPEQHKNIFQELKTFISLYQGFKNVLPELHDKTFLDNSYQRWHNISSKIEEINESHIKNINCSEITSYLDSIAHEIGELRTLSRKFNTYQPFNKEQNSLTGEASTFNDLEFLRKASILKKLTEVINDR